MKKSSLKTHFVFRYDYDKPVRRSFESARYYYIIYILRGRCYLECESITRICGTEDIILMKPGQKITLSCQHMPAGFRMFIIGVLPDYFTFLSDDETQLLNGFEYVPYSVTTARAESGNSMLIKNIALKLSLIEQDEHLYGNHLLEHNLYSMLLILTLRSCISEDRIVLKSSRQNIMMDDLFMYIKEHLTEDLSLERLEEEFYLSRYHICREFKKQTGLTPHHYIVKARLDASKKYIEQGLPINEVYKLSGFPGYNHFFQAFKKEYKITPKEYYNSLRDL